MDAQEALKRFTKAKDYWSENYREHKEDVRFSIGLDHWSDDEIKRRGEDNCMIVPILPQFIHQVVNDMRQNTPSINVIPGEGKDSNEETAKILKGLIRNIEYKSKADAVYDTAAEYAVRGGFGFIIIEHDYIDDSSFLQEIKLKRVFNPQSIYLDPSSVELDGSDAKIGFVLDPITRKEFEERYPEKAFVSFDDKPTDKNADEINICDVFVKEYKTVTKQQNIDGSSIEVEGEAEEGKSTRTIRKPVIKRYRFSGEDLLEETTFPGKYIPIVPIFGEEVWTDERRHTLSLIRLAKGAQRRVNKWAAKESEILDMAPIAPVMAPVGAVEDYMDEWGNPGDVNVMRYNTKNAAGQDLPKPERLAPPQVPTGIINAMQGAKENVKEALGMYNASIGQKSNAISGVAYDAQKLESDVATYHFPDNRNKSIEQVGRIIIAMVPEVYDSARIIQIVGPEEEQISVGINGAEAQEGQEALHDLTIGTYDVRVTVGASYTSKRQEAAALLGDVLKNNPQLINLLGDIWAKNLDVPGAEAMAERLKQLLPPEIRNAEQKNVDPEKEQMAAIIQQLQGQIQQIGAELQSKQAEQQAKMAEIAIKQEEVNVKKAETAIKEKDLQLKYLQTFQQNKIDKADTAIKAAEVPMPEDSIEVLQAKLNDKVSRQQQDEINALTEQDRLAAEAEAERAKEDEERAIKLAELQQQSQATEAVMGALNNIAVQLNQLTTQVSQPIAVIRDENGVIVGAN